MLGLDVLKAAGQDAACSGEWMDLELMIRWSETVVACNTSGAAGHFQ